MASIPVKTKKGIELKELLYNKYKIQIPVMQLNDRFYIRFSINVYNSVEDLDVLYQAIVAIIATTDLIYVD